MLSQTSERNERLCELAARAGRVEVCSEECPLWENGACSLEQVLEPDSAEELLEP